MNLEYRRPLAPLWLPKGRTAARWPPLGEGLPTDLSAVAVSAKAEALAQVGGAVGNIVFTYPMPYSEY